MNITIKTERHVDGLGIDIKGMSQEELLKLRDYGYEKIKKDDLALIRYGFSQYMDEFLNTLEDDIVKLGEKPKKTKKPVDMYRRV